MSDKPLLLQCGRDHSKRVILSKLLTYWANPRKYLLHTTHNNTLNSAVEYMRPVGEQAILTVVMVLEG